MLKLSVIVPVYNVAAYLRKCVNSILAQDISSELYEVILVDDGSDDGSERICDEYASRANQPIIRVIHQPNQGVAMARNNGVALAQAPYVAFLDADDWWAPNYIGQMLALIETYPEAGLYACQYWYHKNGRNEDRIRNLVWLEYKPVSPRVGLINYFKSYYAGGAMPVWTGSVVMPKNVFDRMGGFPKDIRLGEDFLLWAKTAMYYPIAYLSECLSYYNNDIPVAKRATKHLHNPAHHMLWKLDELDSCAFMSKTSTYTDWRQLCDKLRSTGLQAYWLSEEYHAIAKAELSKIDWSHLPRSVYRWYQRPLWLTKCQNQLRSIGSVIKQGLIKRH